MILHGTLLSDKTMETMTYQDYLLNRKYIIDIHKHLLLISFKKKISPTLNF